MMDIDSLAQALFGSKRAETQEVSTDGTTRTYTGVALTDSEDGTVVIDLGGDVTLPDDLYDEDGNVVAEWDGVGVEMPTSPQVSAGDDVIVTLMGGSATKTPMVTSSAGSGDRMRALVNAAQTVADAAQAVAEAVNQHFFADTNGIHVTEATQEEWDESHTGANVLINSIGQLFRDGLNNLLTLTTENGARALTIWDGLGNTADHIRAIIGETIQLGSKSSGNYMTLDDSGVEIYNESTPDTFSAKIGPALVQLLGDTFNIETVIDGGTQRTMFDSVISHTVGKTSFVRLRTSESRHSAEDVVSSITLHADALVLDGAVQHDEANIETQNIGSINLATAYSNNALVTASMVYFTLSASLSSWSSVVIGTLPVGYRPPTTVMVSPYCDSANHAGRCFVAFQADGDIRLYNVSGSTIDTGTRFTATATYVL